MEIRGKLVLVTGASSGIGEAIAKAMAQAGGRLVLLARNEAELQRVTIDIRQTGAEAQYFPVDLRDAEAVANICTRIAQSLGTPDIIINNAGAGTWRFVDETSPAEAQEMMALPYFAAFNVVHAFLPSMLERNSGHIVNLSSAASRYAWPGATAYIAARWALRGFTEALHADMDGTGIGVSFCEAGLTNSPYWQHNPQSRERLPGIAKLAPVITPAQVAQAVVRGVERNKKLILVPFMLKVFYWQHAMFPWLVQWLLIKTGYRREPS